VVALDSTAALLKRISGSQLFARLAAGSLPASLHNLLSHPETQPDASTGARQYALRVTHHDEVEQILAQIRQAGLVIEDLQLHQADLEDVFIQIMGGEQ